MKRELVLGLLLIGILLVVSAVFIAAESPQAPATGGEALLTVKARSDVPGPVEVRIQGWDAKGSPMVETTLVWDASDNEFLGQSTKIEKTTRTLRFTFVNDEFTGPGDRNLYIDSFKVNYVFYEGQNWVRTGGTDPTSPGCGNRTVDGRTVADCGEQGDWVDYELHPGNPVKAPLAVSIDSSLMPPSSALPGFDGVTDRPLATVADAEGQEADFVENELWLSTDDHEQLASFLARWQGEVIATFDPAAYGLTGLVPQYLIRIETSLANTSGLHDDLETLEPNVQGTLRVSSQAGLGLLAAGASEAVAGAIVGVNWVGRGTTFRDRTSLEDSELVDANAFNWPSHSAGSTQDIGVGEAWRALELADKLRNRIKIGILDMGYAVSNIGIDMPPDWMAISNVPFVDAIGTPNIMSCSGGVACNWHGSQVLYAAMGVPDNGYGTAGPAGPVAQPVMVFTLYDFFTSMAALGEAAVAGVRIANMSYATPVPATLSWSVIPFDSITAWLRQVSGMLLFAAAGNDGANVDARDCIPFTPICWEETWHTPCENRGVICVGGLAYDSKNKDRNSNFGRQNVDIYAPFWLVLGSTPSDDVSLKSGTSFSSPFTAGVAGLIWAANPALSADAVEGLLYSNAHSSPDVDVNRYVNAQDAVLAALGPDVPPYIRILEPADGASYTGNIAFAADAEDLQDGTPADGLSVSWTSSIDGSIGTGPALRRDLSFGTHTITATATDSDGLSRSDSATISVVNEPATILILSVTPSSPYQAQAVQFEGTSYDPNVSGRLPDRDVAWYMDSSVVPFATGYSATWTPTLHGDLSLGTHTVWFRGMDGSLAVSDSSTFEVRENPPGNTPPVAVFDSGWTRPTSLFATIRDEARGQYYAETTLCGHGEDREDGAIYGAAVQWHARLSGSGVFQPIATGTGEGSCPIVRLYLEDPITSTYEVRLTVIDSGGDVSEPLTFTVTVRGLI